MTGLDRRSPCRSLPALRVPSQTGLREQQKRMVLHLSSWRHSTLDAERTLRLERPPPKVEALRCRTPDRSPFRVRFIGPMVSLRSDGCQRALLTSVPTVQRSGFDRQLRCFGQWRWICTECGV